jgi:hypothetical protein
LWQGGATACGQQWRRPTAARRQGNPGANPESRLGQRESRSNDLLILARVALQAAIRSENDLFALLKDPTTPPAFPPPVELALA